MSLQGAALAAAGAMAAVLAVTAAIQAPLYALRWYELSNRNYDPGATWLASISWRRFWPLRVFLWECVYLAVYSAIYAIHFIGVFFRRNTAPFEPGRMVKGKPVVILIHGLMAQPAHFWLMRRRLARRAVPNVIALGYDSLNGSIDDHVEKLRDLILQIHAKTGMSEVILIGHSLGGLVAFEYTRKWGASGEVKAVVAMGSPFRGSRITALALTRSARRLHPTEARIAETLGSGVNARFLSLYSRYDQLILPYTNSEHPRADVNHEMDLCGHTGFYFNRGVFRVVLEWVLKTSLPGPLGSETTGGSGAG